MNEQVKSDIGQWILRAALAGTSEVAILAGVCERLNSVGFALVRAVAGSDLLDPG
jgi:hypothetical protein